MIIDWLVYAYAMQLLFYFDMQEYKRRLIDFNYENHTM